MQIEIQSDSNIVGEAWVLCESPNSKLAIVNCPSIKGIDFILSASIIEAGEYPSVRFNTTAGDSCIVKFPSMAGWEVFSISLRDKQVRVAFYRMDKCNQVVEQASEITHHHV